MLTLEANSSDEEQREALNIDIKMRLINLTEKDIP